MGGYVFANPPRLAPLALKLVATASLAAPIACSDDAFRLGGREASGADFGRGGQPFDGGNGSAGGASIDAGSARDSGDASCAEDTYEMPGLPVDIVIAVDTSPSMAEEVAALENRLGGLRDLLAQSQITPHIILLAAPSDGATPGLCVPQPTGSGLCSPQGADSRVPEFFHHPRAVARNALEVLYDEYSIYAPYLRSDSHKTFMVVSDADAAGERYRSADAFIADFDALDPSLLGDWRMVSIHAGSLCPSAVSVGHVYVDIVGRRGYFIGDPVQLGLGQHARDLCTPRQAEFHGYHVQFRIPWHVSGRKRDDRSHAHEFAPGNARRSLRNRALRDHRNVLRRHDRRLVHRPTTQSGSDVHLSSHLRALVGHAPWRAAGDFQQLFFRVIEDLKNAWRFSAPP
jgi:hypothetical protein